MRYASRVDSNQPEIVKILRNAGATVFPTHSVGKGFPDIVVGHRGVNYLVEIKDGDKPPSARKLTQDEEKFHAAWRGDVCIVKNADEALLLLGVEI